MRHGKLQAPNQAQAPARTTDQAIRQAGEEKSGEGYAPNFLPSTT